MIDTWAREKRFFRHGRFPDNSTNERVGDVGHYTQLMWRATHSVGCALARGACEDVLVCRYSEAGNYKGKVPFLFRRPAKRLIGIAVQQHEQRPRQDSDVVKYRPMRQIFHVAF